MCDDCNPCSTYGISKTVAVQSSTDVVGKFFLLLSAAIRESDPCKKKELVQKLAKTLSRCFELTFVVSCETTYSANDFCSLMTLVQNLSNNVSFDSRLVGNFTVEKYCQNNCGYRTVGLNALEQDTIISNGVSYLKTALDCIVVNEAERNCFKIFKLTSTVINNINLSPL